MYNVVLVDDERIIVDGLFRVVPWESYGCRVVATAGNAAQGEAAIRKHKPDILFTDIKMPDRSGLSMLAGLKSEFARMQVIVLSGYSDFDYAREAIRLGVFRYLLKPSKMDEIDEALRAAVQNLKELDEKQGETEPEAESTGLAESAANSFVVRRALEYMEAHYADKLSLALVAEQCYVSQWHLSKLLNSHTNQSFYEIQNTIRINKAKALLAEPGRKVNEICELVGYTDAAHFSRVFKKLTGMSANAYRNSLRQP